MPKVMVLEDEAIVLELLKDLLQFEGYEVINPQSFEGIMDEIRESRPDCVILDVHLKDLNGLDFLEEIRKDDELKDIYVIATSGLDYGREAKQRGANEFIMKPYMPDDLLQLLDKKTKQ